MQLLPSLCVLAFGVVVCATATAQQTDLRRAPPSPTPFAGPAPGPVVDRDSSSLLPEELLGVWSARADCLTRVEFRADGTFNDGASAGTWSLADDTLTKTYGERSYRNHVNQLNDDTFVTSASADAVTGVIYARCAG